MKNFVNLISTLFLFSCNILFSQVTVNDPRFSEQWYLYMPGVSENQRADIRAYEAWSITTGNPNIKIAIIESDQDLSDPGEPNNNHPDLLGRITRHNSNLISDHATEVAGLIAANPNTIGIVGINWYSLINSYAFSDIEDNLDDRINDAVNDGNKIINISQGLILPLKLQQKVKQPFC